LDCLARRDHASGNLRQKLLQKGFEAGVVGEVIERLRTDKLVDDRRYVENFIGLRAARGQGPLRVRAELQDLGIADELVEEAVGRYDDWVGQLLKARQKKFGAALPTDYADRRRQARFLGYRGFTGAQIRMAIGFDTEFEIDG
jgi:regulatory protein